MAVGHGFTSSFSCKRKFKIYEITTTIIYILKKKPQKSRKSDKMKLCIFCQVLKNDKSHESLGVIELLTKK